MRRWLWVPTMMLASVMAAWPAPSQVAGADEAGEPLMLVAGQRRVTLESLDAGAGGGAATSRRLVAVPQHDGWDVEVSARLVPPAGAAGKPDGLRRLVIEESRPDGTPCGRRTSGQQRGELETTDLTVNLQLGSAGRTCGREAGEPALFAVTRSGDAWAGRGVEVEISVAHVRAGDAGTLRSPGGATGDLQPGAPRTLAGGSGFSDARALEPGTTIADEVGPMGRRYFSIPVEYGQSLRVRLDVEGQAERRRLGVTPYNPLRQTLAFDGPGVSSSGTLSVTWSDEQASATAALRHPIMPAAAGSLGAQRAAGVPGTQYLVVGLGGEGAGGNAVRYALTVDVWGEPQQGGFELVATPEQYEAQFGASPTASPTLTESAGTTPSPTPTGTSTATEPTPTEPTGPTASPTSTEGPTSGPEASRARSGAGSTPLALGLGTVGAVLVVAGLAWGRLRRGRG